MYGNKDADNLQSLDPENNVFDLIHLSKSDERYEPRNACKGIHNAPQLWFGACLKESISYIVDPNLDSPRGSSSPRA